MMNSSDEFYMKLALKLSRRGLGRCAPNPCVGAVVVRDEGIPVIIGRGWTQPGGRPHAEPVALAQAGEAARGATLYVTLEPCSHFGKAPPCADAIVAAGISRVVYAAFDPDERVSGRGLKKLTDAGIEVIQASDACIKEAHMIMKGHILRQTENRPFVQVKLGIDAGYKVSKGDGAPVWVTCKESREMAHLLRAQADAILIGRGTAEADDPTLTCRLPGMTDRSPIRVLLDKRLQIPVTHKLFETAGTVPLWVFTSEKAENIYSRVAEGMLVDVFNASLDSEGKNLSIRHIIESLAEKGITRLMVEGGPHVVKSFLNEGVIDEMVLFQSRNHLGDAGQNAIAGLDLSQLVESDSWHLVRERQVGVDQMKVYQFN